MKNNLSDLLIQPNSKEEDLYCKKYNIELERLENGITILGIPCRKDFSNFAHIKYEFLEGAYGNKSGGVHFLEHFINKKARPIAQQNSLDIVARTSQIELTEEVSGIANPKVMDYGIWVVLEEIRNSLESPLETVSNLEKTVETERDVIKAEIRKRENDPNIQVEKHFRQIMYSPENPLHDAPPVTGTESELDNLTVDVLKKIQKKVLSGENLLISFYTEGDLSIQKTIIKEVKNLFEDFPGGDKKKLDLKLLEKMNPRFKPGSVYSRDPGLKNGLITTEFVWIFNHPFPSIKYFGLTLLKQAIATELFSHSRKMGWGYVTDVNLTRPTHNINILRVRVDVRKDSQKELAGGIKKVLFSVKRLTRSVAENVKKRQRATPMSVVDRLSWITGGIKQHDAMIDADKVRANMLNATPEILNELLDEVLATEPVIIVTGDLK